MMKQRQANVLVVLVGSIALAAATLSAANPVLTPGVWTNISPTGVPFSEGNVFTQGLALDPTNPSTIYLCACALSNITSGIYKTTNAGTSWRKIGKITSGVVCTDTIDAPIHIRVDPKNPQHLYCVDGVRGCAAGFFVSNDGGETFVEPSSFTDKANNSVGGWTNDCYGVSADPDDFNHILVAFHSPFEFSGASGILESKDGGNTWIRHFPISDLTGAGWNIWFLYDPAVGIGNSNTWLIKAQGGNGSYRTTDAGNTWAKVSDNNLEHGGGQIYYNKTGTLYSSGFPSLVKSTDNGATWTDIGPANSGFIGLVGDGTHLYTEEHEFVKPFITALESDGLTWTDYNTQTANKGAFELAFDKVNGIVYSASEFSGMLALKVSGYTTSAQNSVTPKTLQNNGSQCGRAFRVVGDRIQISKELASYSKSVELYDAQGKLVGRAMIDQDGMVRVDRIGNSHNVAIVRVR